jgi:hypothetical protein
MTQHSPGNKRKEGKGTLKTRETRQKKVGAPVARGPGGKFLKGVSGNPNGRPTAALEVRVMAREHGPEAIERLVYWMRSGSAQDSIAAAKILLDRGYGKTVTLIGNPNGAPLVNINMGLPITDANQAAQVYEQIMRGDPSIDLSGIKFANREPALIEQQPADPKVSE